MTSLAVQNLFSQQVEESAYQQKQVDLKSVRKALLSPLSLAAIAAVLSGLILFVLRPPLVQGGKTSRIERQKIDPLKILLVMGVVFLAVLLVPMMLSAFTGSSSTQIEANDKI